jgi:hypothetical protein
MTTEEFKISDFKSIDIRFPLEVEVRQAEKYSVYVSGSETFLDNINIYAEGERLVIAYHMDLWSIFSSPFSRSRATISMPELQDLKIAGAARVSLDGFSTEGDFSLFVSGASRLNVGDFKAGNMNWELSGASHIEGQLQLKGNLDIRVSGASKIILKGETQEARIEASGASQLDLQELKISNAKIRLNGASKSSINMNGKLDVDLSGASNLEYSGSVTMGDVRVNGASSLKKR